MLAAYKFIQDSTGNRYPKFELLFKKIYYFNDEDCFKKSVVDKDLSALRQKITKKLRILESYKNPKPNKKSTKKLTKRSSKNTGKKSTKNNKKE